MAADMIKNIVGNNKNADKKDDADFERQKKVKTFQFKGKAPEPPKLKDDGSLDVKPAKKNGRGK